jgi:hypothetical protein
MQMFAKPCRQLECTLLRHRSKLEQVAEADIVADAAGPRGSCAEARDVLTFRRGRWFSSCREHRFECRSPTVDRTDRATVGDTARRHVLEASL